MLECCEENCDVADVVLAEPYLQLDSFCSSEDDPFSCKLLLEGLNEFLPSPTKFSRSKLIKSTETRSCRGAIVALKKPHKIIAVASDTLSLTEFTSGQICGRSINVLFGPRTDVARLTAAIKNTGHNQSTTIDTILCSSTGADLHVTVTFSPCRRAFEERLDSCLLQIDCVHIPKSESSMAPLPASTPVDFGCLDDSSHPRAAHSPQPGDCGHPRQELPSAGLESENMAKHVWRQRGSSPVDTSPEPVLLLDDFGILLSDPRPSPKSQLLRRLRRAANLAAGLENEAERRRQQQRETPPVSRVK